MLYTISTAFAIYFVFWWIVLFLTLPFGVRSQHQDGEGEGEVIPGTDPGAPIAPRMGRKLIWTTLISAVLFAASMLAYDAGYLNVEWLSKLMGMQ
jgi:predicted secreted protein